MIVLYEANNRCSEDRVQAVFFNQLHPYKQDIRQRKLFYVYKNILCL